jgi:hypothetical protein
MGDAGQRWRGGGEARTGERGDERVGASERALPWAGRVQPNINKYTDCLHTGNRANIL